MSRFLPSLLRPAYTPQLEPEMARFVFAHSASTAFADAFVMRQRGPSSCRGLTVTGRRSSRPALRGLMYDAAGIRCAGRQHADGARPALSLALLDRRG